MTGPVSHVHSLATTHDGAKRDAPHDTGASTDSNR